MAPLPKPFDRHAVEVQTLLDEGNRHEARAYVLKLLGDGRASSQVQMIAAQVLARTSRPKGGRIARKQPPRWIEIGRDFEELRADGLTYEATILALTKLHGKSDSVIEKTIRFFRSENAVNVE